MPSSEVPTVPARLKAHDVVKFKSVQGSPAHRPNLDGLVGVVTEARWSPGDCEGGGSWRYGVCFGNLAWDVGECNLGRVKGTPGRAWFEATDLPREVLVASLRQLEEAVRDVVAQEWDDVCWIDVYRRLGALLGIDFDPRMIPAEKMKANCSRFVDSLIAGTEYEKDTETRVIEEHHRAKQLLRDAGFGVTGTPLLATVVEALAELTELREWKERLENEDIPGEDN